MNIRPLFELHYPSLVWYLEGRLGDRDFAEDLAQRLSIVDARERRADTADPAPGAKAARSGAEEAARETAALVNALLRRSTPKVDSASPWARLVLQRSRRWDRPDDGLLTLSSVGEKVTVVIVCEDVDHSGTFTHGDVVRYVSTIPHGTPVAHSAR